MAKQQRARVTQVKASPAALPIAGIRHCASCCAVYRNDFQRCPLDGGLLVISPSDPWVGQAIGDHYVIDALVGEGAMGRVYRAHRSDLVDKYYAIKILVGDLAASEKMRARFQLEAELTSKLAHPNIVSVVDYGRTERGLHYLVMDLVEGPNLGSVLQRGPMDPERVIRLARQLCDGLDHAHGRGVIHRDFKPDNILLVGEGELEIARIADFGLALSATTTVRMTTTGIVCTPAYAAPEQLRGLAIDHRVDLYALGVSMYEMLSGGHLPFVGDIDVSVRSKLTNEAPSVLLVAPNVPPALVSLVGRLLASDPSRRPRTARAVARALDGALSAPRSVITTEPTLRLRPSAPVVASRMPAGTPAPGKSAAPGHSDRAALHAERLEGDEVSAGIVRDVRVEGLAGASARIVRDVQVEGLAGVSARIVRDVHAEGRASAGVATNRRRSRFGRTFVGLFACGLAFGGAFAAFALRGPAAAVPAAVVEATMPTIELPIVAATTTSETALVSTMPVSSQAEMASTMPVSSQPEMASTPMASDAETMPTSESQTATTPTSQTATTFELQTMTTSASPPLPASASQMIPRLEPQSMPMSEPEALPPMPITQPETMPTARAEAKPKPSVPASPKAKSVVRVVGKRAALTVPSDNPELLGVTFEAKSDQLDAVALAERYAQIRKGLEQLEQTRGHDATDELWAAFAAIHMSDAVRTQQSRDEAAGLLAQIQQVIVERSN